MKVLILSAYNAVSHDHLNKGLIKHLPDIDFTLLTLPPRFFAWRSRGNSLSFAFENRDELTAGYDHIFATSLTDITGLRGLVPELSGIPVTVYFHENQFDYPDSRSEYSNVEGKIVSVYNAIAADRVLFNTGYNMESFLSGAAAFLKKMPDHVPGGLIELIREKSSVLHVPVKKMKRKKRNGGLPVILWNHRWEYDKGPDGFLLALRALEKRGFDFRLNVLGQSFRQTPDAFSVIKKEFSHRIVNWGYMDSAQEYADALCSSDIVISTSLHDFQGLSVIEGADAGCVPVLPERVAYPWIFPKEFLYPVSDDPLIEAESCADALVDAVNKTAPDMSRFYWENLKGEYRKLFR